MINIAAFHPPCAKHGEGNREAVEGASAQRSLLSLPLRRAVGTPPPQSCASGRTF